MTKTADYIILGAGASGLQLAYRFANDNFFKHKTILIIDKVKQQTNHRTWCFWEKGLGEWEDILHKTWDTIYFGSAYHKTKSKIAPYQYKMIRSKAYYEKLWHSISLKTNISFIHAEVTNVEPHNKGVTIFTDSGTFRANKVFNSLPLHSNYKMQTKYPVLQQHFAGWFVKTEQPIFDDSVATFMDFDIPQKGNTRFMYVLPTSKTEALFEYTLFSETLLKFSNYEDAIKDYLRHKGINNYTIVEKEKGSIPMTCYKFHKQNTKYLLHIGTAGGWTKASTGYTFMTIYRRTKQLIVFLKHSEDLSRFASVNRFWYFDLLMLDVLAKDNAHGAKLFSDLFKKIKPQTLLKFLDEQTRFTEDLKIMAAVETKRFMSALLKRLL